jgi:NAD(P)-dependent dehydrogenase (short-subunit alcohol dehydrogenase family)
MTTHTSMNALDTGTAVHITPINQAQVALVLNAGTDAGFRTARELLRAGCRVAVTGRNVTHLTRIIHGHSATRVLAIAADPTDRTQVSKLVKRVETGFGRRIDLVVRARNDDHTPKPQHR